MGFNEEPLRAMAEELIVCYFGILHLVRIQVGGQPDYFLKISRRHHRSKDGVEFLTLISVTPEHAMLPVYSSNIEAKKYLGDLVLADFDLNTVLRAVRVGTDLRVLAE